MTIHEDNAVEQPVSTVGRGVPAVESDRRERSRVRRKNEYLSAGLRIICERGFDELTMQVLADDVDAAVGTVYRYFSSKSSLLAEVEAAAVERVSSSIIALNDRVDVRLAAHGTDPAEAAVVRLVTPGRWFCSAITTFERELELLQHLLGEWARVVPKGEEHRVLPAVLANAALMLGSITQAESAGAITSGNQMARMVVLSSSLAGAVQISNLGVFGNGGPGSLSLIHATNREILLGWGVPEDKYLAASAHLDALEAEAPLAVDTLLHLDSDLDD